MLFRSVESAAGLRTLSAGNELRGAHPFEEATASPVLFKLIQNNSEKSLRDFSELAPLAQNECMASSRNLHDRRLADAWATLQSHSSKGLPLDPDASRLAFADPEFLLRRE